MNHVSSSIYTASDGQRYSITVHVEEFVHYKFSFIKEFGTQENCYTYHPKGEVKTTTFDPHTKDKVFMGDNYSGVVHEVSPSYLSVAEKIVTIKTHVSTKKIDISHKTK